MFGSEIFNVPYPFGPLLILIALCEKSVAWLLMFSVAFPDCPICICCAFRCEFVSAMFRTPLAEIMAWLTIADPAAVMFAVPFAMLPMLNMLVVSFEFCPVISRKPWLVLMRPRVVSWRAFIDAPFCMVVKP